MISNQYFSHADKCLWLLLNLFFNFFYYYLTEVIYDNLALANLVIYLLYFANLNNDIFIKSLLTETTAAMCYTCLPSSTVYYANLVSRLVI